MDPDIFERVRAVLSALNETRQRAANSIRTVASNVAQGVVEGIALPRIPDGFRPNPLRPAWGQPVVDALNTPHRVQFERAQQSPMPLTQTLAMLGGMMMMPGPDGPKVQGSFDSPEAFRTVLQSLSDDELSQLMEAAPRFHPDEATRSLSNDISTIYQNMKSRVFPAAEFKGSGQRAMDLIINQEVNHEYFMRGLRKAQDQAVIGNATQDQINQWQDLVDVTESNLFKAYDVLDRIRSGPSMGLVNQGTDLISGDTPLPPAPQWLLDVMRKRRESELVPSWLDKLSIDVADTMDPVKDASEAFDSPEMFLRYFGPRVGKTLMFKELFDHDDLGTER